VATRSGLAVPEGRRRRRWAGGKGRRVHVDWWMRTPGVETAAAEVAGDMLRCLGAGRSSGEVWWGGSGTVGVGMLCRGSVDCVRPPVRQSPPPVGQILRRHWKGGKLEMRKRHWNAETVPIPCCG